MLLSALILCTMQAVFTWLYSHYTPESRALIVRLVHWTINHVGRTPVTIFLFMSVFTGLYLLRSQKIADDMRALMLATEALKNKGFFDRLEVSSGGEIGKLAANLRLINQAGRERSGVEVAVSIHDLGPLHNEEIMALILRAKELIRLLHQAASEDWKQSERASLLLEAATQEALGMERFLESRISES